MQTRFKLIIALTALALVAGCASHDIRKDEAPDMKLVAEIRAGMAIYERVLPVHYKLAISGEPLCAEKLFQFPLHLITSPLAGTSAQRTAYWHALHVDEFIYVNFVVNPAAAPSAKSGQKLTSVNGEPILADGSPFRAKLLDTLKTGGSLMLGFDGVEHKVLLTKSCSSAPNLAISNEVISGAVGGMSTFSSALIEQATTDDELAYVVGREVALNGSGAGDKIKYALYTGAAINGIVKGAATLVMGPFAVLLPQVGAPAAMKLARMSYEGDADKGSFAIMVKAGYDPRIVPAFWTRNAAAGVDHKSLVANDDRKAWWIEAMSKMTKEQIAFIEKAHRPVGAAVPAAVVVPAGPTTPAEDENAGVVAIAVSVAGLVVERPLNESPAIAVPTVVEPAATGGLSR